jgi:hypothetical protein
LHRVNRTKGSRFAAELLGQSVLHTVQSNGPGRLRVGIDGQVKGDEAVSTVRGDRLGGIIALEDEGLAVFGYSVEARGLGRVVERQARQLVGSAEWLRRGHMRDRDICRVDG